MVNNAGYALKGVLESLSDDDIRRQFETNVLGLIAVTKKAIEYFRPKKKGTIIQVSSI